MSPTQRPPPEALAVYAEAFNSSEAMKKWGIRISFPEGEEVVQLDVDEVTPAHRGGLGTDAINGGVLAAMFDYAIGCTPALVDPYHRTATMQLSITFMRPVRGNRIRARGRIDRLGDSVLFASASIYDEAGEECARCQGLVRRSKIPWVSPS